MKPSKAFYSFLIGSSFALLILAGLILFNFFSAINAPIALLFLALYVLSFLILFFAKQT